MYRDGTRVIPSDVNPQDWVNVVLCIPNDSEWFALFRGLVWQLTRGRGWQRDSRQTSIKDAQAIGIRIYDSMTMCNLETALNGIESAIRALERTTAINVCCDVGTQPTDPPVVTPYDPSDPPETIPPHLPQDEDDLLCHLLNTAYGALLRYLDILETVSAGSFGVALIVSLLAIIYPEPITTVLGGVTLTMIATSLLGWSGASANVAIVIGEWIDAIEENFTDFYCSVRGVTDYLDAVDQWFNFMSEQLRLKLIEYGAPEWVARALSGWIDLSSWAKAVYNEWYENGEWIDSYPANPLSCDCVSPDCTSDFDTGLDSWYYIAGTNGELMTFSHSASEGIGGTGCLKLSHPSVTNNYSGYMARDVGQVAKSGGSISVKVATFTNATTVRVRIIYDDSTNDQYALVNGSTSFATINVNVSSGNVGKIIDRVDVYCTKGTGTTLSGHWLVDNVVCNLF